MLKVFINESFEWNLDYCELLNLLRMVVFEKLRFACMMIDFFRLIDIVRMNGPSSRHFLKLHSKSFELQNMISHILHYEELREFLRIFKAF